MKMKKVYGRYLTTKDLMKVYKLQLFDHSEWINLSNGLFEEKDTGDKQSLNYLFGYISRGLTIEGKVICARKYRAVKKYSPIRSVKWVCK